MDIGINGIAFNIGIGNDVSCKYLYATKENLFTICSFRIYELIEGDECLTTLLKWDIIPT